MPLAIGLKQTNGVACGIVSTLEIFDGGAGWRRWLPAPQQNKVIFIRQFDKLIYRQFFLHLFRRCERTKTATRTNHIHATTIGRVRGTVQQDTVSGHIYARRSSPENQSCRITSSGNCPMPIQCSRVSSFSRQKSIWSSPSHRMQSQSHHK